MTNPIETADRLQLKYMRGLIISILLGFALLIVRYIFGTVFSDAKLNSQPIGILVLAVTVVLLILAAFFCVKLAMLANRAMADPKLKEALIYDEVKMLHIIRSWKAAFLGAVITPYVFLIISSFHPINDLLLVAFTTTIVGAGAFLISLYMRNIK